MNADRLNCSIYMQRTCPYRQDFKQQSHHKSSFAEDHDAILLVAKKLLALKW